jgi:hypothetical protein
LLDENLEIRTVQSPEETPGFFDFRKTKKTPPAERGPIYERTIRKD